MKKPVGIVGILSIAIALLAAGCSSQYSEGNGEAPAAGRMAMYTTVKLTSNLDGLSANQREMVRLLIEACRHMDDAFWLQAYGDKASLLESIDDPDLRRFAEVNYGPWDRLGGNEPFIDGVGAKPEGAALFPTDMTRDEFEAAAAESKARDAELKSLYTVVRRAADGSLEPVPYSQAFAEQVAPAAEKLRQAAKLAEDPGFKRYLELRAEALVSDDYLASDMAWMDMKNNAIDVVIGPIESYEDQLFGYKASFEGYVLIKDREWSERLARYAAMLPGLQKGLPVAAEYKRESPGTDSDLNAYEVVFYAGDCNAGAKTIAINLPNDEQVQLKKGTRRLQLKNAMRAKFEKILLPIADLLVAEDQRKHITFDAFFANTMFHEVAHGLGIKQTLDGSGTVRQALREQASSIEEGKADVLGLYMVSKLHESGEIGDAPLEDYLVTFMAGIFRSIRFGASSAHGRANLARFGFFEEMGAFTRDPATGSYRVEFGRMREAMDALSEKLLRFQGDADYDGVVEFMERMGTIGPTLQQDLDRLTTAGIPVDVVFEQGPEVLGLR